MRSKSLFFLSMLCTLTAVAFFGLAPLAHSEEQAKIVKAIDVKGNKTVSSLTILAKVKTHPGDPLSSTVLNEDLKRLYGLGYFTDVRIEQEDATGGVKVLFLVTEKPVLSQIQIEGNKKINKDQIKKEMQSVIGDFVDQKRVRDDLNAVRSLYEKKGYSEAKVDSVLDVDPATNQAMLKVMIDEGEHMRIKRIEITGNSSVKSGAILKVMKTKASSFFGWFRSGYLKEEDLADDVERIKDLYDENGFSDAEVETQLRPLQGSSDIALAVEVTEGKKYVVGEVQFKGNSIVKTEELLKTVQMKSDKPFSRRGLRLDVANIQDLYFDKGYLSSQIRSESIYNEKTDKVDVTYTMTENELTYVDRVRIQGNTKTKDTVIRRELRAYPGESFSGAKLKRSKERLYNLGFFEDVRFDTEPGSLPNARDLLVTVKESKTGEFSFGGGYSSIDSVIGFVQIRQKNFDWQNWKTLTGAGQDMALRVELGSVRQNYELSFTEPWAFGYPFSLGFDLYKKDYNRSGTSGYGYDLSRVGGDIRLGKEFNEFDKALLMYKLEEVKISNVPDTASQGLKDEIGENTTSSLSLTLTHDERDNIYNPSKGIFLQGSGELAGGFLSGDKDFWKLNGVGSTYFKNFEANVLELKIRAGVADEYDDTPKVPIYERYYAGGANTIRGYRERRVGPRDTGTNDPTGGEAYWIFNVEETFPIYPDILKGAVFYDVGAVYSGIDNLGEGDVAQGVGAGVRIKTPIGPVKIDVGYPLDDVPGEGKKLRFYFNISQGF